MLIAPLHLSMPPRRLRLRGLLAALLIALAIPGAAQELPAAIDPGLQEQRLLPRPGMRERLGVIIARDTDCRHMAPDERTTVILRGTVIEGEVQVDTAESTALWRPHLERAVTLAELCAVAMQIAAGQAEAARGALHAVIPRQRVVDGVVHIRIVRSAQDAG